MAMDDSVGSRWMVLDGYRWMVSVLAADGVRHLSDDVGRVLIFFKFAVETVVTSVSTA